MLSGLILVIVQYCLIVFGFTALAILAILIHELGHCATHLAFGHRIVWIRVGPLKFEPPNRWTWHWRPRDSRSGSVLAQLRSWPTSWTLTQEFLAILAGPLANILASLALLPVIFADTALSSFATIFTIVSSFVGFYNLIPFKRRGIASDGLRLCWLLFSSTRRRNAQFLLTISIRLKQLIQEARENRKQEALIHAEEFIMMYSQIPEADIHTQFLKKIADLRDCLAAHSEPGEVPETTSKD